MKRLFIISCILIIIGVAAFMLWAFFGQGPTVTEQSQEPITFPVGGNTGESSGQSGNTNSLLDDPDVMEDAQNPGSYYVGNQPTGPDTTEQPTYLISYDPRVHLFSVSIFSEPIGEVRRTAEAYLMGKLGATEAQMCSLNYLVAVPYYVNEQFSGMNLGFSFCPGAVQLP